MLVAIGVYGAMALGGQAICHFIGIDKIGGFNLSANVAMEGLGYAIPPMMALLFILDVNTCSIIFSSTIWAGFYIVLCCACITG